IGPRTGLRLQEAGILTIGQLRKAPLEWLQPVLGRQAKLFRDRASGHDQRPVSPNRPRRSISQETTFDTDLHELDALIAVIGTQAERCARGLVASRLYARVVHLKLRSGGFSTLSRSRTLTGYTRSADTIAEAATEMLNGWVRYQSRLGVRLIGVGVSALEARPEPGQLL
ncbi:MAG: hypothetical protein LC637_08690, partial [Xanthomonadaceae bacterium]|nr:hypothetical protein [Xanthomonadaceae bacterium]